MRIFLFILSLSTFISCSSHNEKSETNKEKTEFLPKECIYPNDKIGNGKTFVYSKVGAKDETVFQDLKLITESGVQYRIEKLYTSSSNYDSSKYNIENKLLESFTFILSDISDNKYLSHPPKFKNFHTQNYFPVRGELKENTYTENGKIFSRKTSVIYTKGDSSLTSHDTEEYLKDTVFTWQGKQLDCIVSTRKRISEFSTKTNPLALYTIEDIGVYYSAKGVGVVRYTNKRNNVFGIMDLVEIKDTP